EGGAGASPTLAVVVWTRSEPPAEISSACTVMLFTTRSGRMMRTVALLRQLFVEISSAVPLGSLAHTSIVARPAAVVLGTVNALVLERLWNWASAPTGACPTSARGCIPTRR